MQGPALNALTLGEDTAETMGIRLVKTRYVLVIGVAAMIGATTAVTGAVGFVGLVVPHILRRWVKSQPSRLMWASMLGGAAAPPNIDAHIKRDGCDFTQRLRI